MMLGVFAALTVQQLSPMATELPRWKVFEIMLLYL